MSGPVHVWNPPADVRAAGEAARRVVRYAGATPVAAGVQEPVPAAVEALRRVLVERLAGVPSVGAVRPSSRLVNASVRDPHRNGFALDVMIRPEVVAGQTRAERGDAVANWLVRNAVALDVQYVRWSELEWSASRSGTAWETGADGDHFDHVHFEIGPNGRGWSAERMRSAALAALEGDAGGGWLMLVGVAGLAALAVGLVRWAGVR